MKAVVITAPGAPEVLQVQERPTPSPAPHQVLVRVHAAGINRPDVAQRKGQYPPPAGAPVDIPGLEIAGTVEACGSQVDRWQPGDAVCALLPGGGYAEYAVVDARHCLPLPNGCSFAEAASLPETLFTVWHNVFQRGQLQPQENFLVHGGSSGIGITAIQLAKAWDAQVFATAGSPEKCQACEDLGADRCLNYKTQDFEEELTAEGVDVVLDMVGGTYIAKNLNLLKPDGRLVFINAMQGANGAFDERQVMQKRLSITGSTLRPRDADFKAALTAAVEQHVWPLLEAGKFKPVIYQTFSLEQAAQAHALMESSTHIGKMVLLVQP
ncbi:NAD(P)H-quinone oxidoreductase [Rufibacter glacialis]|uniref:NAD(P)H-quinone oxidoreductase n=1 Tax=Rufibacter glacialis TaxID=1259555 RepID=A0A5M8QMK5_9BACT|nr:NAD(P)H-quinone oxidoreductase [Rufibacter glacialis]KAA6435452.1 NAD(P)H-quinone oxidoreductase [Rufibacter glacialis]GGK63559.1 NAD(P)H quinone oxidoreductase [Rufibacter glacialis]